MPIHDLPSCEGQNLVANAERPSTYEPETPRAPLLYDANGRPLASSKAIGFMAQRQR